MLLGCCSLVEKDHGLRSMTILEFSFKIVKVTIEVVLSVSLNVVFWIVFAPVVLWSQTLSSHVNFNELLESIVSASKSGLKPVDSLSLKH